MILRKYFVSTVLAGAALLAVSCDPASEPSVSLTILSPMGNQTVPHGIVPVSVRCEANKCTVDSLVLRADGLRVNAVAGPPDTCNLTWDASTEELGSWHLLTAVACYSYDAGARFVQGRESASVDVRVDTGGPDVRFVSPQDGDMVNKGSVPITVWAKEEAASGMDRVEFLIDEVLRGTDSAGVADTWRYTWDASQASAGSHAIKARAYNGYGEIAVEVIGVFVRDTSSGGGPTYHHGYIDTSETWSPGGNPHIVDADVMFRNGAWLTVEPGCIVKVRASGTITFGLSGRSGLTAVGTASAPVLFTSDQAAPAPGDWFGFLFGDSTMAGTRLSYCTIEYAGYPGYDNAVIKTIGSGRIDEISDCTIRHSGLHGVHCRDSSDIGTFRGNVVTANRGFALLIGPGVVGHIGSGNVFTGNDSAGVELDGKLKVSAMWPDFGVPYVIKNVRVGDSANSPVLTIQPGTEVRFKHGGWLRSGVTANSPGRIIADGSAGRISFTSVAATPAPGDFGGVSVYDRAGAESEFRNCAFSYGGSGSDQGCMLYVQGSNPTITGCDFGYSSGWGITFQTAAVPDTVALKLENAFHDNVTGAFHWIPPFPGD